MREPSRVLADGALARGVLQMDRQHGVAPRAAHRRERRRLVPERPHVGRVAIGSDRPTAARTPRLVPCERVTGREDITKPVALLACDLNASYRLGHDAAGPPPP